MANERITAKTGLPAKNAGVSAKDATLFAPTKPVSVRGSLRYDGPPKTPEEMDRGITMEVMRLHARSLRQR